MKKISRNLWLKLAAFIVCSVMAAGLAVTTLVAVYTNNYESTAQLRDEIHANIAGAYSRQMVYNYESGDDNAFSQMMDDTNLQAAVVKSNETSEDKVDVKSDAAKVYSSVDEISNPDYIFSYKAKNLKWNRLSYLWDVMSGSYEESDDASNSMNSERISSIMYSKTNGLFYLCLNDGTAYVIPKVRVMTGSNDNSSLGLYKAVEKTDENGNNYFAYEEMFTGQSLDITGFAEWKKVKCYDEKGNQCFCDTCAPPTRYPRNPASMISFPAKYPSGRLNVLPALGYSSGCFSARCVASSFIRARMACSSPAASFNTACVTI